MAVIRQRTQVLNQPVGVVRAAAGSQQLAQSISRAADTITDITFERAAEDAQKKGIETANAVEAARLRTFNPETGRPEAYKAPEGFGRIAAQAYQSVIDKRFEDSIQEELKIKAQEIALKYPYNASGYADVMGDYIASMSENAGGQYAQFIKETGERFLSSTKLNIQERAASRARANLSNAVIDSLDKKTDDAYNLALAGGFIANEGQEESEASAVLNSEVGNVSNAVNSGLLKKGADRKATNQLTAAIARGGVEYIHSKTKSEADRNAVDLAIRTRGKNIDEVPAALREDVRQLIKFINPNNIEDTLRHSAVVAGDYNAVDRDIAARQKAETERRLREAMINMESNLTNMSVLSGVNFSSAFDSDEDMSVTGAMSGSDMIFRKMKADLDSAFVNGNISDTQYSSELKNTRQGLLYQGLLEAASEGNVEELRVAAINPTPANMANLSDKQREFITSMHQSQIYNPMEDNGFVRETLQASLNSIQTARDKERTKFNLAQEVSEIGEEAAISGMTDQDFESMRKRIAGEVGKSLSAVEAESLENQLNRQRAFGDINVAAAGMNSFSLNALSNYIETQGQDSTNMTPEQIALGNQILAKTRPEDINALTGKIDGIRVRVAREEAEIEKATTKRQNITRIGNGGGNVNNADDRKLMDEILEGLGVNLSDPSSQTPQTLSLLRSAPSQSLITSLQRLTVGLPVNGSDVLLNHFVRLESDLTNTGVMINRFGTSLSRDEVEFLNDINQIRTTMGGNVNEIAQTLYERRNDPKSKLAMDIALGGKTPTEYVTSYTDGFFSSPDPLIAKEIAPAVEYLARTGKSQEQINQRLEVLIDQSYPETDFIADPRFPVGSIKRSRYSLLATIPEDDDREEFLRIVESQLPAGYSLFSERYTAGQALAQAQGFEAGTPLGTKQVKLVPDETTAGVTYFAYFVDDANELRPLIYDIPSRKGEPSTMMFPAFDLTELDAYRQKKAAEKETDLRSKAKAREDYYNELRRSAKGLSTGFAVSPY